MPQHTIYVGRDRGAGDREKRGREVYGRREKRGWEAGFPRWREAGEEGKNYATLRNISQSKKCKGVGAKKYRAGSGRFKPPCPPPHLSLICHSLHHQLVYLIIIIMINLFKPAKRGFQV